MERYVDVVKGGRIVGRKLIVDKPAEVPNIKPFVTNEEIAKKLEALEAKIDALGK